MASNKEKYYYINKLFCINNKKELKEYFQAEPTFPPQKREKGKMIQQIVKILPFVNEVKKSSTGINVLMNENKRKRQCSLYPDDSIIYNKIAVTNTLVDVLKNEASDSCVKVSKIIKKEKSVPLNLSNHMKYISKQCYDLGYSFNAEQFIKRMN